MLIEIEVWRDATLHPVLMDFCRTAHCDFAVSFSRAAKPIGPILAQNGIGSPSGGNLEPWYEAIRIFGASAAFETNRRTSSR